MSGGGQTEFQVTKFTMPNNISSMKNSLKSVPGLADVGVPHGFEDGAPELHQDVWRGQRKFQMSMISMIKKSSNL